MYVTFYNLTKICASTLCCYDTTTTCNIFGAATNKSKFQAELIKSASYYFCFCEYLLTHGQTLHPARRVSRTLTSKIRTTAPPYL